jgi:hypothetical protein
MRGENPQSAGIWGVTPLLAIAGDQLGLLAALLIIFAGTVVGLYSRKGSGIAAHPWGHRRSCMAPGAAEHDEISGRDEREHTDVSFGTR